MISDKEPFIWIVIPTWNRGKDLNDCLVSINNLRYSNFKVVIVDNCSQDDTVEILKRNHPDVNLIKLKNNKGASFATNQGFEFALEKGADLVLRLDSDTVVDINYLKFLSQAILELPEAGIVSGKIMSFHQPEKVWFTGGKLVKMEFRSKIH